MNKLFLLAIASVSFSVGFILANLFRSELLNPYEERVKQPMLGLKKYSFEKLRKANVKPKKISIGKQIGENDSSNSYLFFLENGKRVSGLINIPKQIGIYPVAILLRGYVDKEIYTTGVGSQRVGEFLADNGFITLAPDFLGYGKSSKASNDSLEERFQTYTTVLELLSSIKNVNIAIRDKDIGNISLDTNKVVLWGHSNGGQIALSILAITGRKYPTVLWAPVSKPFPYSILYYTDEYSDHGKYLRRVVAGFEKFYDIDKYDPTNYYEWIKAPIQIHQGIADEAVPLKWSNQLYEKLSQIDVDVNYYIYEGDDHNLMPNGWSTAAQRALEFYNLNLQSPDD